MGKGHITCTGKKFTIFSDQDFWYLDILKHLDCTLHCALHKRYGGPRIALFELLECAFISLVPYSGKDTLPAMNSALLNPRTFRPAFRSAQYLPLFSLARPCTSPKCSSKPLPRSTTQVRGAVGQVQTYRPTLRPQRAMTNELKELQKKVTAEQLPEDVGLLAGTFIRPLIRRMPSLLKEPKTWQLFLWTALKCWVKNAAMLVHSPNAPCPLIAAAANPVCLI